MSKSQQAQLSSTGWPSAICGPTGGGLHVVGAAHRAAGLTLAAVMALGAIFGCAQRGKANDPTSGCLAPVFTAADVGRLPAGWTALVTNGDVANTVWQVAGDTARPAERCLSLVRNDNGPAQFNLCVHDEIMPADLDLSAACEGDFGVGIVWRCLDADDYYVCRVNPAEGNFNLYKLIGGRRVKLATTPLDRFVDDQWYHLRAVASGDQITCYLDGRPLLAARDASLTGPGRIGVWTRADALGSFRQIEVRSDSGFLRQQRRGD